MGVSSDFEEIERELKRLALQLRLELTEKEGAHNISWQNYTSGHLVRTGEYAEGIARALGLNKKTTTLIRLSAELHDAGKIYIDNDILFNKIERGGDKWKAIWRHPYDGLKWLKKNTSIEVPKIVKNAIKCHHENWDGSGYPGGPKEGMIRGRVPDVARIIRPADSWDAATSDRPYKKRRNTEDAVRKMKDRSGTIYEPTKINALFKYLRKEGIISKF
ncbi:MAG: HD-GYP domain-containing protein [Candidatus Aenigmatarchaeota archaeon]